MPPASLISWCDFDIARSEEELAELDRQAADPDLWNDADTARDLMQRLASVRERVEAWNTLQTRATDTVGMLELAIADEDESFAESAASEIRSLERELSRREFELRLSGLDANRAVARLAPLRPLRPPERHTCGARRCWRHRIPGLGGNAPSHVSALGRAPRIRD